MVEEARSGLEARLRMLEEQHVRLETMFSRILPKLEAMIEGRSGDQERDSTLVRSVDRAHEKIQNMTARQDRIEARQNKIFWLMTGAVVAIQFLFAVITWLIEHRDLFSATMGAHH